MEYIYRLIFLDGLNGVFDVEDLVDLLRRENCYDICVIEIPPELQVN